MKVSIFRPIEQWKSALMTLPDSNFFELMRSIFGSVKTPFNKQRLVDDLFMLLSKEEIRQIISGYLDERDHKLIAAVALLKEPEPVDLDSFFTGDLPSGDLHTLLLNLEERLIIYRIQDGDQRRLALNPALESVLAPIAQDGSILFPSSAVKEPGESKGPAFIPDNRAMAALFAFCSGEDDFFKAEGGIRKKVLEEGKRLFPGLDLELSVSALLQMGLFSMGDGRLVPEDSSIKEFGKLSSRERREYWAAGIYLSLNEDASDNFALNRGCIRVIASFIRRFCELPDPERQYPKITLRRFAGILNREDAGAGNAWGYRLFEKSEPLPFDPVMEAMEKTGLIDGTGGSWRIVIFTDTDRKSSNTAIAMDSSFSFIIYPEIQFADALALSGFCSAKGILGTGFELTRRSAVTGFDRGLSSAYMLETLDRLSGGRIDSNLGWTLKDWETRYNAVSLRQGLVLTLSEDRRYLAEAEPVASLIRITLAPGVYLIQAEGKSEAVAALRKAGVDIIAQPAFLNTEGSRMPIGPRAFPHIDSGAAIELPVSSAASTASQSGIKKQPSPVQERFRQRLKDLRLGKAERDELSARIERRLVLSDAQLEGAAIRHEKLEARGLDYVGKSVLAKQAIASGSLLEVSWPRAGGGVNQTRGIPSGLEKKEGESVLVLKPVFRNDDQGEELADLPAAEFSAGEIRLPLGRISLLRRIKQSIFGE
ncbi:hypothetical protein [Leadbettera azotonutricia]|uniref:Helicase XPB/Ssl2 N-terminal domain-containing protein n=1 Tax=Leadbettera azotonutricia (strain ATCC BAA-888 / DSM 13862 / ZAS-9) TaxID=545695 RepID=F5YCH4_LEAAZ|nr:hypothetical protein [Leadbettera azotonutricia]AEF82474.1 conserved hypothetical protein [Leadbettera azotonutricia ZAS-9]